jgi:dTDP-4-amino-4,6-dideoxygalactose transaminase
MLGEAEIEMCAEVIAGGMLIGGRVTEIWRSRIAGPSANLPAQLFCSGRQALRAALAALMLPPGSGVVVPTYACEAVAWAIRAAGLRIVPCDNGQKWLSTPETVEMVIDDGCGAILLAPPFGLLQSAAAFRRFGVPIIHDLCQASPQTFWSSPKSELGDIAVLSFHPTKYLCAGGGGATFDLAGNYRHVLETIEQEWFEVSPFGELQAALGNAQLDRLEAFGQRRSKLFDTYCDVLPREIITALTEAMDVPSSALHRMPLLLGPGIPVGLFDSFASRDVTVRLGVDNLIHRKLGLPDEQFPNAILAFDQTLSAPFHPSLSDAEADRVASALAALL